MWVSDVLKDPTSDKLPFVGAMPEKLPFEIQKRANKKDDDPSNNRR